MGGEELHPYESVAAGGIRRQHGLKRVFTAIMDRRSEAQAS
jgi:hypothetical protein